MKLDNKTLWNEAGRVGFVFGGFSSLCLLLKEGAALTGSNFLITAAAVILWAVEFFGCILLMKKYMLDLRDKFDGVTVFDTYRFGRCVGLLSGLILAALSAIIVMNTPEETITSMIDQINTSFTSLGSISEDEKAQIGDRLPLFTFLGRWVYCFLYGSLLSAIMSRYIYAQDIFRQDGGNREDDNVDNQ